MSKRRVFTPDFKARVVLEELSGTKDKAEICREYRLRPQAFSRWQEEFLERAPEIFATERSHGDEQERIAAGADDRAIDDGTGSGKRKLPMLRIGQHLDVPLKRKREVIKQNGPSTAIGGLPSSCSVGNGRSITNVCSV